MLPPNTVSSSVVVSAEPGAAVDGTWVESSLNGAVEVFSGVALEAGYALSSEKQVQQKLDGFAGPLPDERLRHGPDAALVLDDGTSLIRLGYRFRTCWDGTIHAPSVVARTLVLSQDTTAEVGYRRTWQALEIPAGRLPARDPVDAEIARDSFHAALEQGFVPGWNLRLDLAARLDSGFLQNPFRSVSLWSTRVAAGEAPAGVPRVESEHHPESRVLWGAQLRVRRLIQSWATALELGGVYGTDSWRVQHASVQLMILRRFGEFLVLRLGGGAYHQTRAAFYRDEYPQGPEGAYWSADRSLSSFIAWWAEAGAQMFWIPERGRLLGMFKHLALQLGFRASRAAYGWEGADSPNGFSAFQSFAGGARVDFDGGMMFGGWFGLEGGF